MAFEASNDCLLIDVRSSVSVGTYEMALLLVEPKDVVEGCVGCPRGYRVVGEGGLRIRTEDHHTYRKRKD